jgi:multiple sugar transport system permease protein
MNLRKFIIAIICVGALLWYLYPSINHGNKKNVTELTIWAPGYYLPQLALLGKYFEKENPNYRVIIGQNASRNMDSDNQRFLCGVAGGVPPDIIMFGRNAIIEWAARGAFENLNTYLDADATNKNISYPIHTNNIVQSALLEATYKNKIYGIPSTVDDRIFYYNKDLLIKEGLVDENGDAKPPRTWEELEEYALRLTKTNEYGNITQLGFAPMHGNSWLYLYGWENGARFLSKDGKKCTLNSPEVVEALEYMVRVYDELGGIKKVSMFQSTFQAAELDPFLTDKIAMFIDLGDFMQVIATYRPNMNFGTAPPPMPKKRLKQGAKPVTWLGGWCYSIPSTSKHKNDAWKLIRWLTSKKAIKMVIAENAENNASQGKSFIPILEFDNDLNEYIYQKYILNNPQLAEPFKKGYRLTINMLKNAKFRPNTPVGQLLWSQQVTAFETAVYHKYPTAKESLDEATRVVQKALDRFYNPPTGTIIKWKWLVVFYLAVLLMV